MLGLRNRNNLMFVMFFSEGYYLGYLHLGITHHAYHCLFQNLWITGIFMLVKSVVQFDWFAESGKPTKLVASFAPSFLPIYHLCPASHGSVNHRPLHTSVVCGRLWFAESGKPVMMKYIAVPISLLEWCWSIQRPNMIDTKIKMGKDTMNCPGKAMKISHLNQTK